ncbi:MAG: MFS transporter [Sphingomonadales bacterium]|nr:MFS transporter [Sphingomonadales bacterium]
MAWLAVVVLFVLYIRSLADRYLMALMVDPIKHDLGLSDTQIGLLQGPAFAVLYALCAIPVGLMLDRHRRRWVLFGCIVVWSLGAGVCGLAGSFIALAMARSLVGGGESGFTTGAYSIIGDTFRPQEVSTAMSVFVMGGVMGAGIVFLLGGPLVGAVLQGATSHWPMMAGFKPWQQAFLITGFPGVLTAFLVFLFPEPSRQKSVAASGGGYGEALAFILAHRRAFGGIILGIGLVYSVTIGLQLWSPAFLGRVHGWKPAQIGMWMGVAQMVPAATLPIHGRMVDRWFSRGKGDAHLAWCLATMAIAGPCAIAAYLVSSPQVTVVLFGAYMMLIMSTASMGPAAAQVVTPPHLRGRVSAVFVLVTGLVGMVLGNLLVGLFTDHVLGDPKQVGTSLVLLVAIVLSLAAVLLALGRAEMRAMVANKE